MSVTTYRRYLRAKILASGRLGAVGTASAWLAKLQAQDGLPLPEDFPSRAALAAADPPYERLEDLEGATRAELVAVGLTYAAADAVLAATDQVLGPWRGRAELHLDFSTLPAVQHVPLL